VIVSERSSPAGTAIAQTGATWIARVSAQQEQEGELGGVLVIVLAPVSVADRRRSLPCPTTICRPAFSGHFAGAPAVWATLI